MAAQLSYFEASALVAILSDTMHELSIMKFTLIPENPSLTPHFDCPGLRLPPRELDVRKLQNFRFILEETVTNTILSLLQLRNFLPLILTVEKLKEEQKDMSGVLRETEQLPKKLKVVREDLERTADDLCDEIDPGRMAVRHHFLDEEERQIQDECSRKRSYFEKWLEARRNHFLEKLKTNQELIRHQIQVGHFPKMCSFSFTISTGDHADHAG